jgi:uncharacterized phage-associated protein
MYSAIHLSKYIVSKCVSDGHPISNLQLQKMLYYIQKDYLSRDDQAFSDDIEAWQFGPVVPEAYYRFCGFGAMPITIAYDVTINPEDAEKIDPVVEEKRRLNPWDMVTETHKPNGAWDQIYKNGLGNRHVIPIELIKAVG